MPRISIRFSAFAAIAACAPALAQPHVCGTECSEDVRGHSPVTLGERGVVGRGVRGPCAEDGSTIDIMIAYTPAAATAAGGVPAMETLAADSIAELNAAFAASGVPTTAVLVAVEPVAQNESGISSSDLARLRDQGDGFFDEVHTLRDAHRADLVSLFVGSSDVCGRAYIGVLPTAVGYADLGFSIVLQGCATGGVHAFAHEIGHNMGLLHDFQVTPCNTGTRPYAHGYVAPDESFRTVMATSSTAPRELMFSTPAVMVGGLPAGDGAPDVTGADAALALTESAAVVAKFWDKDRDNDGECDADEIVAGTMLDCDANGVPDDFDQDFNRNGVPDACDIAMGTSLDTDLDGVPDEVEVPVLYVDEAAWVLPETGVSWANAMSSLQDAMTLARASGDVDEIWVKYGTYFTGPAGARSMSFRFADGIAVRGGFLGFESDPSERSDTAPPTVLTGDTMYNDGSDPATLDDNAFHVCYIRDYDNTVELDRLTVYAGNANDGPNCSLNHTGGGILTLFTDVLIKDCTFQGNRGVTGAAAGIHDQTVSRIYNSDFSSNESVSTWGIFSIGPSFVEGWAPVYLSGDKSGDENLFINNTVTHNTVQEGVSGMFVIGGQPTIAGCLFAHNTSSFPYVHAVYVRLADGTRFINNVVADNTAPNAFANNGTGFVGDTNDLVVKNSIFWNNSAGGVVNNQGNNFAVSTTRTGVDIDRLIVDQWDATLPATGSGNDPMFTAALNGDYTLLPGSPAIDAGDNAALPADVIDEDNDADTLEAIPFDIAGNARFLDDPATADTGLGGAPIVDIGAHEFAPTIPPCPADIDGDGDADPDDIQAFVALFVGPGMADIDNDGDEDPDDIAAFVNAFVAGC